LIKWQRTNELGSGRSSTLAYPFKKRTQFETVLKFSARDQIIRLKITPQARNKWDNLPTTLEVRLVTRVIKGKAFQFSLQC